MIENTYLIEADSTVVYPIGALYVTICAYVQRMYGTAYMDVWLCKIGKYVCQCIDEKKVINIEFKLMTVYLLKQII